MYAVIKSGGKQYKVEQGQRLRVEKLDGAPGDKVSFPDVLFVGGEEIKIGQPHVAGARVEATIIAQDRAKKIIVFKFRRRKNYRRKAGHRQPFTELKIESITGLGPKANHHGSQKRCRLDPQRARLELSEARREDLRWARGQGGQHPRPPSRRDVSRWQERRPRQRLHSLRLDRRRREVRVEDEHQEASLGLPRRFISAVRGESERA